jgi:hypothetical protein
MAQYCKKGCGGLVASPVRAIAVRRPRVGSSSGNILRFVLSYRMGNCVKHGLGTCSYQMRDHWHPNALASSSEGEERWA